MASSGIRQKIHQYINMGDDKLLELMYSVCYVASEYNKDDNEYEFSPEEIKLFEERTAKRLRGESKIYNWKDVDVKAALS